VSSLNYTGEIMRKVVHISSSTFPIMLIYLDLFLCKLIFSLIAVLFLILDWLRVENKFFQRVCETFFGVITRPEEKFALTGATYVFISVAFCTVIFEHQIAIISLFCLSICDSFAAIVGIPFGKHKFFDKSLEGSAAFFISSLVIFFAFGIHWFTGLLCGLIATLIESKRYNINDNLLIPISIGCMLTLMINI